MVAGAAAGVVSRMVIAPLDQIKILRQTGIKRARDTGIEVLRQVVKEQGFFLGLWKGNSWALVLWSTYGAVQFPIYEQTRRGLNAVDRLRHNNSVNAIAGAIASSSATILTYPFDYLRTRYIVMGTRASLRGIRVPYDLYRGIVPTCVVIAPTMGLTFSIHEWLETSFGLSTGLAGGLAGTAARALMFPGDTIKRRMMGGGLHEKVRAGAGGVIACVRAIVEHDGFLAFYHGLTPSLLKSFVSTAVTFYVYDWVAGVLKG